MKKIKHLNFFWVALMYVGTIVGAGFASGREIWQFFGVFGSKGLVGVCIVGLLFILLGIMTSLIASILRTGDMGRVIVPGNNSKITDMVGYFMALFLFTAIVNMSAAGGALLNQQFGFHPAIGGFIVVLLVILTVIGGFDRMSKIFAGLMPVLLVAVISIAAIVIAKDLPQGDATADIVPSPLASHWGFAPILYMSYNMLAIVPIVATSTRSAKSGKQGVAGAALGGVFLAVLAFVLCKAMLTDPAHCQAMDLPMLALANKLGPVASFIYTVVLFVAIYSSATGNFYGFSTKIKNDKNKNIKIIGFAMLGFVFGLVGFKNIVAYVFPALGLIGLILVVLLIINFFKVVVYNIASTQEKHKYDFPEGIINVTTGRGGASLLIIGEDKTALMDCSMAYCGDQLVEKIKSYLGDRPLDYLFASHTHYDHIGALPSLRKAWPNLIVFGAKHGQEILKRQGALKGIKKLGDEAARMYSNGKIDSVSVDGMAIDKAVYDGDVIDLGGKQVVVLETPGHTNCSITYVIEPLGVMLACESVGVLERRGMCHPAILTNFDDAIASIDKCEAYKPKRIIVSHYGIVPEDYNEELWKILKREAYNEKQLIEQAWNMGMSEEDILSLMTERYWYEGRAIEQPLDAFQINMINTIRLYKPDNI